MFFHIIAVSVVKLVSHLFMNNTVKSLVPAVIPPDIIIIDLSDNPLNRVSAA